MTNLEMLSKREQLMEDIDCIVTEYFTSKNGYVNQEGYRLIRILCDAACKNFYSDLTND